MPNVSISADRIEAAKGADQDAMWAIVTDLEPMLGQIVRRVTAGRANAEDTDDLMQEARFALITCVRAYETDGPGQLQTKAYQPVYGAVAVAWMRSQPGITVEPWKALEVRRALASTEGDVEAAFALVDQCGNGTAEARRNFDSARFALVPVGRLDAPLSAEDGSSTLADTIADPDSVASVVDARVLADLVLASVTSRRALVLRASYGVGMPPMEDAEIAGHLGNVPPSRVKGIRFEGIKQARTALGVSTIGIAA